MASPCAFAPGRDAAGLVSVTLNPNSVADGFVAGESADVAKCSARAAAGSMQGRPLRWKDAAAAGSATQ